MPSAAAPDVRLENPAGGILKKNKERNTAAKRRCLFLLSEEINY
jgi:hypothetical protein